MKKRLFPGLLWLCALCATAGLWLVGCTPSEHLPAPGPVTGTGQVSTSSLSPGPDDTSDTPDPPGTDETVPYSSDTAEVPTDGAVETESPTSPETTGDETSPQVYEGVYLSSCGWDRVASGQNIIVLILDRFDVTYYERLLREDPLFFSEMEALNGFTLYTDNVPLYSRTYPAVCSMITGIPQVDPTSGQEFGWDMRQYFSYAYTTSPFLQDLKANGYGIRLYMEDYYTYRSTDPLVGVADNLAGTTGVAGALPDANRYPAYQPDDVAVFERLRESGLSLDGNENSFIYLHLSGCHAPCTMGADGNYKEGASVTEALRGCFRLISLYIDELKRLGVYDDATILITGDHPAARSDTKLIAEPRLSPVFFKPAHSDDRPLCESTAQVSQENLLPSLVKAAGLTTTHDYGTAYADVPEGVDVTRYHKFEVKLDGTYYIAEYRVTGNGHEFSSWEDPVMIPIDALYK